MFLRASLRIQKKRCRNTRTHISVPFETATRSVHRSACGHQYRRWKRRAAEVLLRHDFWFAVVAGADLPGSRKNMRLEPVHRAEPIVNFFFAKKLVSTLLVRRRAGRPRRARGQEVRGLHRLRGLRGGEDLRDHGSPRGGLCQPRRDSIKDTNE